MRYVFTSHSLRRTCNPARRLTAMQSHGGRQLVAELPQCLKKHRFRRGDWLGYRAASFELKLRKKSAKGLATTQLIGPRL